MRMWVCAGCGELWGAPLLACARCQSTEVRPVDRRDASHPVLARFPARVLPPAPVAAAVVEIAGAVQDLALGPAPATGRRRRGAA